MIDLLATWSLTIFFLLLTLKYKRHLKLTISQYIINGILLDALLSDGIVCLFFQLEFDIHMSLCGRNAWVSTYFCKCGRQMKPFFQRSGNSMQKRKIIDNTRWRNSYSLSANGELRAATTIDTPRDVTAGSFRSQVAGYGTANLNPPSSGLSPHQSSWTACLTPLILTYGCLLLTFSYTISIKGTHPRTGLTCVHACTKSFAYTVSLSWKRVAMHAHTHTHTSHRGERI